MAKDMERILIQNIHINTLNQTPPSSWQHKRFFDNNRAVEIGKEPLYAKRNRKYLFGTMVTESGCIHVEFMMYSMQMGDLLLTVSLPDLYFGNNSHHLYFIDFDELIPRILKELRFVLAVKELPDWKEWGLSRDEQTIDIRDSSINNTMRYNTCNKHKRLPRKAVDKTYADQGSLYFHTGKSRKKAGRQLIVYNKTLQQSEKGINLNKLLHLQPDYNVLRIEEKTKGSPLETNVTNTRKNFGFPEGFTKLEIAFSQEHQLLHTRKILSELGLDKKITTKNNLYAIIESLNTLSPTRKKTCKRVVKYLNGEISSISLEAKTITRYKKEILTTGYHFLYAEAEVPAVGIDEETGRCLILNSVETK